jgi:penicillin-binding protein 1B
MIKNSLLTRDKTYERKFKEALMALLLELSFDKKEIRTHNISGDRH